MSNDLLGFAAKLHHIAAEGLPRLAAETVAAAAEAVAASIREEIQHDIPGGTVAGGTDKVGVQVKVKGDTAIVAEKGPLHLVSNPTDSHDIRPKRKQALAFRDVVVNKVRHPGTRGKRTWQKGVEKSRPYIDAAISVEVRRIPDLFKWGHKL